MVIQARGRAHRGGAGGRRVAKGGAERGCYGLRAAPRSTPPELLGAGEQSDVKG